MRDCRRLFRVNGNSGMRLRSGRGTERPTAEHNHVDVGPQFATWTNRGMFEFPETFFNAAYAGFTVARCPCFEHFANKLVNHRKISQHCVSCKICSRYADWCGNDMAAARVVNNACIERDWFWKFYWITDITVSVFSALGLGDQKSCLWSDAFFERVLADSRDNISFCFARIITSNLVGFRCFVRPFVSTFHGPFDAEDKYPWSWIETKLACTGWPIEKLFVSHNICTGTRLDTFFTYME